MSDIVTSVNELVVREADTAHLRFRGGRRGKLGGWGGSGGLFEARSVLTFSAFRMGAYSRWALIRG